MDEQETMVAYGSAIKALGDGKIGGYLVRFSTPDDPDLEGEYFTKDTDFGPHETTIVWYQHAMDGKLGRRVFDPAAKMGKDEVGVWIQSQIALRDAYEKYIYAETEKGRMGWSSGTAGHLVDKETTGKAQRITFWPLGLDASITPTPAEPRNAVMPLKGLVMADLELAEEQPEAAENVAAVKAEPATPHDVKGNDKMDDVKTAAPPVVDVEAISAAIYAGIFKRLSEEPAYQKALLQAPEGKDHPEVKSFGDYLVAIQRGDYKRIEGVYKAALAEGAGATGGYLVPAEYASGILTAAYARACVRRCNPTIVNMTTREWNMPTIDYSGSTAGTFPQLGGVVFHWTEEAGDKDESEPTFKNVKLIYHELSGYTLASHMVLQDAPALESTLRSLFSEGIALIEDWAFLNGTGAGQPLGIFQHAGLATEVAASATFVLSDAANMLGKLLLSNPNSVAWLIHRKVLPLLIQLADGSGAANNVIWIENARDGIPANMRLLGYPVYICDAMPVMPPSTSAATKGGVLLGDFSKYLIGDRSGVVIEYSDHYKFVNNQRAWKVTKYLDGQPWMNAAMYLPDGSNTVAPFVTLAGA